MHSEALAFARQVWELFPPPHGARILELGSYNVNGSARALAAGRPDIHWWGIDLRPGPDVDEVADARWWRSMQRYDYVICMEMLEHTPEPECVIATIAHHLAPGGRLIITCAGPYRPPHGVDGGPVGAGEHYGAIRPVDLERWLRPFAQVYVSYDATLSDVYATAVQPPAAKRKPR